MPACSLSGLKVVCNNLIEHVSQDTLGALLTREGISVQSRMRTSPAVFLYGKGYDDVQKLFGEPASDLYVRVTRWKYSLARKGIDVDLRYERMMDGEDEDEDEDEHGEQANSTGPLDIQSAQQSESETRARHAALDRSAACKQLVSDGPVRPRRNSASVQGEQPDHHAELATRPVTSLEAGPPRGKV
eukprot:746189-Hanusia_phi.AAC.3